MIYKIKYKISIIHFLSFLIDKNHWQNMYHNFASHHIFYESYLLFDPISYVCVVCLVTITIQDRVYLLNLISLGAFDQTHGHPPFIIFCLYFIDTWLLQILCIKNIIVYYFINKVWDVTYFYHKVYHPDVVKTLINFSTIELTHY